MQGPRPRIPPIIQIVLLLLGAGLVFVLIVVLSQSRGGPATPTPMPTPVTPSPTPLPPTPEPLQAPRDDVALVHSRVILALQRDDAAALFQEYDPAVSGAPGFYGDLIQEMAALAAQSGPVTEVQLTSPPLVGVGGDTAEAEVQVVRERDTYAYRIRYLLAGGQWWLERRELLPVDQP